MPITGRHRVSFNCDIFLDIDAPIDATSEDLERLVIKEWREATATPNDLISDSPLAIPGLGHDAYVYPRLERPGQAKDETLENFTVEDVEPIT